MVPLCEGHHKQVVLYVFQILIQATGMHYFFLVVLWCLTVSYCTNDTFAYEENVALKKNKYDILKRVVSINNYCNNGF